MALKNKKLCIESHPMQDDLSLQVQISEMPCPKDPSLNMIPDITTLEGNSQFKTQHLQV